MTKLITTSPRLFLRSAILAILLAVAAGSSFAGTAVLVSIAVVPVNPSIAAGHSLQFTAIGTFSDASSQDLTESVTWSSNDPTVATISNALGSQGLATGLSSGTTQITAQLDSVVGSTTLTVTNAVLVAIDVVPANPSLPAGQTLQFTAIGTFSDGTSQDVTEAATWSSTNHVVANVSNAVGSHGLATGLSVGMTQISAQLSAVSGSTTLTVTAAPTPTPTPFVFSAGSLIVPMDISTNGQNTGMLRAYGLVYELLRKNVPVRWVINPAKAPNGDDFSIVIAASLQDFRTGATVTSPRSYRGGPFVIAASDAAAAGPIITAWQAAAGDNTAVHRLTTGSFAPNVARTLIRAPRIAVLKDGNETIAFNDLNAAGIPDSTDATWSSSSPDLLTEADVNGPTTSNHTDGALFYPGGLARYGYLASMHYQSTALTPEVVQEVRSWLTANDFTHAFMQCEAIRAFENDPAGHFLTTLGLTDDGSATVTPIIRIPSDPLAQVDGTFEADSGAVDSIGLVAGPGSAYKTGVSTLINESAAPLTQRIVMLSGNIDGIPSDGKVTYLAGHDYSVDLPISSNPQTNGLRLFLNSIFESGSATDAGQADMSLTKTAPVQTNSSTIAYTINYTNPGPRPVENLKLTDKLPAGTTYVVGSGVPAPSSNSGGVLTWNLPPLGSGASGSVTFSVSVTSDGTYANTAQMLTSNVTVRSISSNTATTVRDTVPPSVTIVAGPTGLTNDSTPSFRFTTDATAVSSVCAIDNVGFAPCAPDPASYTSAALTDGPHTFYVRATDAVGNSATATRSFTVDTIAPIVTIPGPPINPIVTNNRTPSFVFMVTDASPTTTVCRIDGDAFVPCVSPFTAVTILPDGLHKLDVRATDAATNVGSASFAFAVDTTVTPTPTATPAPTEVHISGNVSYCATSSPHPVANVTFSLTGDTTDSTLSDGSGNYTLTGVPGGSYVVTPSKADRTPSSSGIDTLDALAAHLHYLNVTPIPVGCRRDAADVNGDTVINTVDVLAIQRFYIGRTFGTANVGKYQFTPVSRAYMGIVTDQTAQDYGALIFGDIVDPSAERPDGPVRTGDAASAGETSAAMTETTLPEIVLKRSGGNLIAAATVADIDANRVLVGFQGDFNFDERVVSLASEPVQKAGLTGGNWNVSGNVLPGKGPIRTLRVSAFSCDLTPLSGIGTLFELRTTGANKGAGSTQLIGSEAPNEFIFIDADLHVVRPSR